MRNRVRRQSYVDRDLERQARAYAAGHGLTDSAVTEAALSKFLKGDGPDSALVLGRLDAFTSALDKVQHDLDVLAAAFGRYTKYWFFSAPTPVRSTEARQQAEATYRDFLRSVSAQLAAGVRLAGEVYRAGSSLPPRPGTRGGGDGGKGGNA
jgi:hypothetical protein